MKALSLLTKLTSHLHHPTLRLIRRFLPSLVGLSVIGFFLATKPDIALEFKDQLLTRLGILVPKSPTPQNPVTLINNNRTQNNLKSLTPNATLDSLAQLIALTHANSASEEAKVDLKQLSSLAGYRYSAIAYLALINPTPNFPLDYDKWLTDNKKEIQSTTYTQIGASTLSAANKNNELIIIVVLASPLNNQASKTNTKNSVPEATVYSGTQLWDAVQAYRTAHGVPPYKQDTTLCTISSIRLNQQLSLGHLDNHDGFSPLVDRFRKDGTLTYSNIGENLVEGYESATEAVNAWDGSPGHAALLKDGAYAFACTSANHGFGVLIAAF